MKPVLRLRLHATQSQPCFPAASNPLALPGGKAEDYSFIVNEDGSYTVEIKIPWSTLGGKAEVGRKIGFDVQVDDPVSIWSTAGMRAEPMYRSVSIWNGDTYNWSNSAKFGTIILSE